MTILVEKNILKHSVESLTTEASSKKLSVLNFSSQDLYLDLCTCMEYVLGHTRVTRWDLFQDIFHTLTTMLACPTDQSKGKPLMTDLSNNSTCVFDRSNEVNFKAFFLVPSWDTVCLNDLRQSVLILVKH